MTIASQMQVRQAENPLIYSRSGAFSILAPKPRAEGSSPSAPATIKSLEILDMIGFQAFFFILYFKILCVINFKKHRKNHKCKSNASQKNMVFLL